MFDIISFVRLTGQTKPSAVFGQPLSQQSIDRINPVIEFLGEEECEFEFLYFIIAKQSGCPSLSSQQNTMIVIATDHTNIIGIKNLDKNFKFASFQYAVAASGAILIAFL